MSLQRKRECECHASSIKSTADHDLLLLKMPVQTKNKSGPHDARSPTLFMIRPPDITDALRASVASRMLAASETPPIVEA